MFLFGTILIWKVEKDKMYENCGKIEQMKQLIEIKQGIELKILLEETDSLITEMEVNHGR